MDDSRHLGTHIDRPARELYDHAPNPVDGRGRVGPAVLFTARLGAPVAPVRA